MNGCSREMMGCCLPPRANFGFGAFRCLYHHSCKMDERVIWERNEQVEWKSDGKSDIKPRVHTRQLLEVVVKVGDGFPTAVVVVCYFCPASISVSVGGCCC